MEDLPWQDDSFDLVTGFNSFFLAADMVGALSEARRVARPGGAVALTSSADPSGAIRPACSRRCGGSSRARPPHGQRVRVEARGGVPALHEESVIRGVAGEAGLQPTELAYLEFAEEYPDVETMARGMLAAPPGRGRSRDQRR